jgi:hypothetical protein
VTQASHTPLVQHSSQPSSKREYIKPSFRHEIVFETMALSCGKIAGTQQACNMNRKTS